MFFLEYSFLYHIIKISFHDDSVILYCFSRLLFYDAPIKKHIVARKYIPKIYKLDMQIFIRSSLAELFIIEKITNESALSCFIFRTNFHKMRTRTNDFRSICSNRKRAAYMYNYWIYYEFFNRYKPNNFQSSQSFLILLVK